MKLTGVIDLNEEERNVQTTTYGTYGTLDHTRTICTIHEVHRAVSNN
jgi:hypothetical protein